MMFDIKDKVAIVTGANTGLGQAICVAYAKAGAKVLGVARRSCAETKAKIDAIGGIFFQVHLMHLDELIFLLIMLVLLKELMQLT